MRIHLLIVDVDDVLSNPAGGRARGSEEAGVDPESTPLVLVAAGGDRRPDLGPEMIERLRDLLAAGRAGSASSAPSDGIPAAQASRQYLDRVAVKAGSSILFVRTGEIDYIEADGNYVKVHAGKATHMLRESIGSLEAHLDPSQFRRIHRSTIVRVDRIRELRPGAHGDYRVLLTTGAQLTLSRTYRDTLNALVGRAL